jgi:hypothetical protein
MTQARNDRSWHTALVKQSGREDLEEGRPR